MLNSIYARISRARRRAFRGEHRQRRLQRPVVSVGNLRVGGSGKTPTVAHLARVLIAMGERPAILSRGYARRRTADGVVVVSDRGQLLADLDSSGDEPLMLARAIPGASVLVASDRHLAGVLAERHLGATVHLLDDGFQHLPLYRDVDLLVVGEDDVADGRTFPTGRLREPLDAAACADALLVPGVTHEAALAIGTRLGVREAFGLRRIAEPPLRLDVLAAAVPAAQSVPVYAIAGIANPNRFFRELSDGGWNVAGTMRFGDHHRYTATDAARIVDAARSSGAAAIATTEKDLVRLLPLRPLPLPVIWVPLAVRIEPDGEFQSWLAGRLAGARRGPASTQERQR